MRWLIRLLRNDRLERDLERELRFHVDEDADRLIREGVPRTEARRLALAAFGGMEPMREYTRDARGTGWVRDLGKDLSYARRIMWRQKGFTAAAILSLGIGIGANAALFSITDAVLLRPLTVTRSSELVFLTRAGYEQPNFQFSHAAYQREQAAAPDAQLAAFSSTARVQLEIDGPAELRVGQLVTGNLFDVLGVSASAGRLIVPGDAASLGSSPVAVISYRFWSQRFGLDPGAVGRSVRLNGVPVQIVGVAAEGFQGLATGDRIDVWLPVTIQHDLHWQSSASNSNSDGNKPWLPQDGIQWLSIVARIPAASHRASVGAALGAAFSRDVERRIDGSTDRAVIEFARREHLELVDGSRGLEGIRDGLATPLVVLVITAAIVLLIGCANLAGLLLARGAARSREFALRLSLGAGRGRLIRQMVTETLALAGLGGLAGLGLAVWGSKALLQMAASGGRPIPVDVGLDWTLVIFTTLVSLITGLAFGLAPAIRLSRPSVADEIKPGGRVVGGGGTRRHTLPFGRVLVVGQVALSMTLLVAAILFSRTLANLARVDAGYERVQTLVARFDPRLAQIDVSQVPALAERMLDEARRIPGVRLATVAFSSPTGGSQRISGIVAQGQPRRQGRDGTSVEDFVGPDYFRTLGMTLLHGRDFTVADAAGTPDVVVINETMARAFFGKDDPVGKRIGYDEDATMEIVGVVKDAKVDGLRAPAPRMIYHSVAQHRDEPVRHLFVRVSGEPEAARQSVIQAIQRAEPRLAVREVLTLDEMAGRTVANERLVSNLTAGFGALAVLVACIGLFGTISYSVTRRTSEIGVRMALGASPGSVMAHIIRETAWMVLAGTAAGIVVVVAAMGFISTLLFGLSPRDPLTLAASAVTLIVVGLIAGLIPALRASRIDPLRALRTE